MSTAQKTRTIPRDYQLDVVKDTPLHVDFLRLKAGTRIRVDVPVHFINQEQAPGLKRGGSLNVVRHTIEMLVPADNIPESLTADLSGLDFNDSLHISAIKLPEGCTPTIRDRDFTVVTLAPPSARAEEAAAPAAAAAGCCSAGRRSRRCCRSPRARRQAGRRREGARQGRQEEVSLEVGRFPGRTKRSECDPGSRADALLWILQDTSLAAQREGRSR